jgi:hypothetical protein
MKPTITPISVSSPDEIIRVDFSLDQRGVSFYSAQ